jgi:hypothetical protein
MNAERKGTKSNFEPFLNYFNNEHADGQAADVQSWAKENEHTAK